LGGVVRVVRETMIHKINGFMNLREESIVSLVAARRLERNDVKR